MPAVYVALALAAAFAFAVASVLKHRSAEHLALPWQDASTLRCVIVQTVRHPLWLIAIGIDAVGSVLQIAALAVGPLDVVQPLVSAEVVLALVLTRVRPGRASLAWAAVLAGCLALISVVAVAGSQTHPMAVHPNLQLTFFGAIGIAMAWCIWLGRRRVGRRVALACGLGTGLAYAACAALISELSARLTSAGWAGVVLGWQLYVLVGFAAAGLVLGQLSFRAGPLAHSLPAATAADVVVSVAIGIWLLGEPLGHGPAGRVGFVVALALSVVAIVRVNRDVAAREEASNGAGPAQPAWVAVRGQAGY